MKTNIFIYAFNEAGKNNVQSIINIMDNDLKIKETISNIYNGGYHSSFTNVSHTGIEKVMGVCIDYRFYLKRILVCQCGQWNEYYAPNKTILRKCLHGKVSEMVYINKK